MHYVGVGKRAVAIIMDAIVFFFLAIPTSMVMGAGYDDWIAKDGLGLGTSFVSLFFINSLVWFLYFAIMEGAFGATVGKMIVGIRVRTMDGGKITWGQSIIRNLLRIIDALPAFYLLGAIIIWTGGKAHNQRLGDIAAKTVVLEKDDVVNPQGHVAQTPAVGFKEAAGAPMPTDETPEPPSA